VASREGTISALLKWASMAAIPSATSLGDWAKVKGMRARDTTTERGIMTTTTLCKKDSKNVMAKGKAFWALGFSAQKYHYT
jgi:hypothetical protein